MVFEVSKVRERERLCTREREIKRACVITSCWENGKHNKLIYDFADSTYPIMSLKIQYFVIDNCNTKTQWLKAKKEGVFDDYKMFMMNNKHSNLAAWVWCSEVFLLYNNYR